MVSRKRSRKSSARQQKPLHFSTLLAHAKSAGYKPQKRPNKQRVLRWLYRNQPGYTKSQRSNTPYKQRSFADEIRQAFSGRSNRQIEIRRFKNGNIHKTYSVNADTNAMREFLSKNFSRKIVNIRIAFKKGNKIEYVTSSNAFNDDLDSAIEDFDRKINRYNIGKAIGKIVDVQVDVWGSENNWQDPAGLYD